MSQFHYGSIKTTLKEPSKMYLYLSLNSTMVRLKQNGIETIRPLRLSLNSTMVRLKLSKDIETVRAHLWSQFHYGSIKTEKLDNEK